MIGLSEAWIKTIRPFRLTPDEAKRNAESLAERMRQY